MMSIPQEHDYIGLSEDKNLSHSEMISSVSDKNNVLNLKETELRLGLPGWESPDRRSGVGVCLFGKDLKDETSNVFTQNSLKRGFSDATNGSGKWDFSINGRSEIELGKNESCKSNNSTSQSCFPVKNVEKKNETSNTAPASKTQVVGWPPIRSLRRNSLATKTNDLNGKTIQGCLYVKVSMDGAPYLRKIDLRTYCSYAQLSSALEKMFTCFTMGQYRHEQLSESHLMDLLHGSESVLTYEDKDGDWMLVGDVPWDMFIDSCKRLRIMKGSDAIGLAPRTMQKCKSQN